MWYVAAFVAGAVTGVGLLFLFALWMEHDSFKAACEDDMDVDRLKGYR